MKACLNCRYIVGEDKKCPRCGSENLTEKYSGEIVILNADKSEVAKIVGINMIGKFAVKLR